MQFGNSITNKFLGFGVKRDGRERQISSELLAKARTVSQNELV